MNTDTLIVDCMMQRAGEEIFGQPTTSSGDQAGRKPEPATGVLGSEVASMFDRIAPTYDRLNRLLSLRGDVRWRDCLARALAARGVDSVLDVATGTADLLLAVCRHLPHLRRSVGVDLAPDMLRIGRDKLSRAGYTATMQVGDAHRLLFADASFDAVTVGFGIRNMADRPRALAEMHRVLKPGGTLAVLEFGLPKSPRLRALYLAYFRHMLPAIGRLISGDARAYRYLNNSVEAFPSSERFVTLLRRVGFTEVTKRALTFGVATLYLAGRKGRPPASRPLGAAPLASRRPRQATVLERK